MLRYVWKHRSLLAGLVMVLGMVTVLLTLNAAAPHDVKLLVHYSCHKKQCDSMEIEAFEGADLVYKLRRRFPKGCPERWREVPELPPGRYDLRVTAGSGARTLSARQKLSVPVDGTTRVRIPCSSE